VCLRSSCVLYCSFDYVVSVLFTEMREPLVSFCRFSFNPQVKQQLISKIEKLEAKI